MFLACWREQGKPRNGLSLLLEPVAPTVAGDVPADVAGGERATGAALVDLVAHLHEEPLAYGVSQQA